MMLGRRVRVGMKVIEYFEEDERVEVMDTWIYENDGMIDGMNMGRTQAILEECEFS